ncbi:MAG: hypothetical protein HOP08_18745 [Cyclobacteriaceae bacterium]|nr:hypothetical protein [Cyclobacteriaceae bacterium]
MVSEEVRLVFEMPKAEKIWTILKEIGLNPDVLTANFNGYYQGRRKTDPYLQPRHIFLEWGEEQLQPIVNRKLNRSFAHPTFNAMMKHCLRDEIAYYNSQHSKDKTAEIPQIGMFKGSANT